jgi:hypothetical protein
MGGATGTGAVFKIKISDNSYTKLYDFDGTVGTYPEGSLISDGTYLYGMALSGGTNSAGTVFKIKISDNSPATILDFNGDNGRYPTGSLLSDGTYLYGMAGDGGTSNMGTAFKIKISDNTYTKLLDFTGTVNGSNPYGSFISDGTFLYGMTYGGGTSWSGTGFKIQISDNAYTNLWEFTSATGIQPQGSLINDGSYLYGVTGGAGPLNNGTVFKYHYCTPPVVTLVLNPDPVCINAAEYTLTGGLPEGGTYSGTGVSAGNFNPNTAGLGLHDIFYTYTDLNGCTNSATAQISVDVCTDISSVSDLQGINIFPNPGSGIFTIESRQKNYEVIIVNALGEEVYSSQINSYRSEVDLRNQPNGIYFLSIKTREGVLNRKLIINK